ncbi:MULTISPECIES: class I SAM-dependent methyltransferase [Candidatus Ichthyocystis]|uniref:class I SAM-dependent methyltransferase n=1 Tax=Candidatus Ichthyocystis TaxID=2929841 RepID=UPI000B862BBC|nr:MULTISPECIES: SAM-dependent methyltransferase [Ichthyocystis]
MNNLPKKIISVIKDSSKRWIPFSLFMEIALYDGEFGYYMSTENQPFGTKGDFITAPILSNHLGRALVSQWKTLINNEKCCITELGAGDGSLACTICNEIEKHKIPLKGYKIYEISPHLKKLQKKNIESKLSRNMLSKVSWIDDLQPRCTSGIVFGNEVIDAIPCELLRWTHEKTWRCGITAPQDDQIMVEWRELEDSSPDESLEKHANDRLIYLNKQGSLPYESEVHPKAQLFFEKVVSYLDRGILQIIDYGFEESVYYMPSRPCGTLMCHNKQLTHDNFLSNIGSQDISVHVNFSLLAEIAHNMGLTLHGYISQGRFFTNVLNKSPDIIGPMNHIDAQSLQILINPHEMGEIFKVITWEKNMDLGTTSFSAGDISYKL